TTEIYTLSLHDALPIWMSRDAEMELSGDAAREAMWAYERAVTHLGLQPVYLSPEMLVRGELRTRGIRALILPHAIALGANEERAIRAFAAAGGKVIADVAPGAFDAHSRRVAERRLGD